jgi:serine/threonine protein kinase
MERTEKMARNCQCTFLHPDEWVKGKLIGSGSFGSVHLAMSKSTGGLFVVKSAQSVAGLEALENEAKILLSLNSRHIIWCLGRDLSSSEHKLNVVMEYMAGGSLSDVAENFGGVLEEEVIQLYAREILLGLKYLHENGIVHCDLKCKNVLLGSSGDIKLADFGCAKRLKEFKANGVRAAGSWQSIGGTPLWMAPEVLRDEGMDFASDIWSLGCTVVEMGTGRPPWSDEISNPMAAVLKIACSSGKPKFPTKFSNEGVDFLDKCFKRDPKRRWTAEELLNHPFVSRNSMRTHPRKQHTFSPASVFDIGIYDSDDYDDSESTNGEELPYKNPFSRSCGERKTTARREQAESDLASSDIWITVRSGGCF